MSFTKFSLFLGQANIWSELAGLLSMLASTIWLVAWHSAVINSNTSWWILLSIFFSALSISHYLSRLINRSGNVSFSQRLLFLAWVILIILLSLKIAFFIGNPLNVFEIITQVILSFGFEQQGTRQFFHVLAMAYLIWRGIILAKRPNSLGDNVESFQAGLLIFLIYGMAFGWKEPQNSIPAVGGYLFISLIGMNLGRIASLGTLRGGRIPKLNKKRILAMVMTSLSIALFATLMGWLFRDQVSAAFAAFVLSIFSALMTVFWAIASPVLFFILEMAFRLGEYIFSRLTNLIPNSEFIDFSEQFQAINEQNESLITEQIKNYDRILMIGIIIIVIFILAFILRIKPWQIKPASIEEEATQVTKVHTKKSHDNLNLDRLSNPFQKLRRYLSEARIRRVYAQFMDFCARLDHPRPPAMTPLEFVPTAQSLFSSHPTEINIITQAYMRIRYGEAAESDEEINQVITAWDSIKKEGKHLLAQHKRFPK